MEYHTAACMCVYVGGGGQDGFGSSQCSLATSLQWYVKCLKGVRECVLTALQVARPRPLCVQKQLTRESHCQVATPKLPIQRNCRHKNKHQILILPILFQAGLLDLIESNGGCGLFSQPCLLSCCEGCVYCTLSPTCCLAAWGVWTVLSAVLLQGGCGLFSQPCLRSCCEGCVLYSQPHLLSCCEGCVYCTLSPTCCLAAWGVCAVLSAVPVSLCRCCP